MNDGVRLLSRVGPPWLVVDASETLDVSALVGEAQRRGMATFEVDGHTAETDDSFFSGIADPLMSATRSMYFGSNWNALVDMLGDIPDYYQGSCITVKNTEALLLEDWFTYSNWERTEQLRASNRQMLIKSLLDVGYEFWQGTIDRAAHRGVALPFLVIFDKGLPKWNVDDWDTSSWDIRTYPDQQAPFRVELREHIELLRE